MLPHLLSLEVSISEHTRMLFILTSFLVQEIVLVKMLAQSSIL
jgi:hypothetical protein